MLGYLLAGGEGVLSLSEPFLAHAALPDWRLQRFFRHMQQVGGLRRRRPPYHGDALRFEGFLRRVARENGFSRLVIKETFRARGLTPRWTNARAVERLLGRAAGVVALIRDPFDVAASTIKLCRPVIGWGRFAWSAVWPGIPTFRNADDVVRWAAENWAAYVRWTEAQGLTLTRYEALVADPAAGVRAACAALGLPYSAGMLDERKQRPDFGGLGDPGVLSKPRPVDRTAVGRGTALTEAQRGFVRSRCAREAARIGYEEAPASSRAS